MSKAELVIDMPESCYGCYLTYQDPSGIYCGCTKEDVGNYAKCRSKECPLRKLPEKKRVVGCPGVSEQQDFFETGKQSGWNACIDAITGGET